MKRRDFLKILGMCVVAPGIVIATVKTKPKHTIAGIDTNKPVRWTEFKSDAVQKKILIQKMRRAFKNTKFKRPVFYYKNCPIYYQSPLA